MSGLASSSLGPAGSVGSPSLELMPDVLSLGFFASKPAPEGVLEETTGKDSEDAGVELGGDNGVSETAVADANRMDDVLEVEL
ncbi:MAG: hypothetical protein Q9199_007908 [Rusavskia elegans]